MVSVTISWYDHLRSCEMVVLTVVLDGRDGCRAGEI
jgi:hypothetical protein